MNKNLLKKLSIFFIFAGILNKIYSYPECLVWAVNGNKNIVIIGDDHELDAKIQKPYIDLFKKFINKLSSSLLPIHFILEFNEDHFAGNSKQAMDIVISKNLSCLPVVSNIAVTNKFKINNIKFIAGDRRTSLIKFFYYINKQDKEYLKKIGYEKIKIKEFFNEINKLKESCLKKLESIGVRNIAKQFIEDLFNKKIKPYLDRLLQLENNLDLSVMEFYNVICEKEQKTILESLFDILRSAIADLGFIDELLTALNESDFIFLYVGTIHSCEIRNLVIKMGNFDFKYDLLGEGEFSQREMSPVPIEKCNKVFNEIIDTLMAKSAVIKPATVKDDGKVSAEKIQEVQNKICVQCKKESNDMKMCSNCKKVHYCSVECQRVHWKAGHKQACKKV